MSDKKPTLLINDRLSKDLDRYRASMFPGNTWRKQMEWWVPWAKELEEQLAIAQYERDQLKKRVASLEQSQQLRNTAM